MADGTTVRIPRERIALRKGAVPSIFLSNVTERSVEPVTNSTSYERARDTPSIQWDYDTIVKYIHSRPTVFSEYWVALVCPNFILWNSWNDTFMTENFAKRVILKKDMKVNIDINGRQIKPENILEIREMLRIFSKF